MPRATAASTGGTRPCSGSPLSSRTSWARKQEADRYARDGLALAHRIGDRNGTILGVAELARLAAVRGHAERAGRLWAALEREAARTPLPYWDRARKRDLG